MGDVDIRHLSLSVELPGDPGVGVRVAEWSKAPDSSSGPRMWAWVQITSDKAFWLHFEVAEASLKGVH